MATLLQIKGLHKSYDSHLILDDAELAISENEKVAVIGRNGAGKSTLFKIIVGEEAADEGEIRVPKTTTLGYLTQHNPYDPEETVMEFLVRSSGKEEWMCGKTAGKFQIKNDLLYCKIGALAGGYQMRVKLISMLLHEPNLLLLDEPTNYLDLSTQLLFEQFLKDYKGAFMLISHDREFIKRTCTETLEIDQGKTTLFPRPLEEYLAYKAEQLELAQKFNKKVDAKKQQLQKFVDRFGAKASKAGQAQSKLKQIDRLKTIEIINPLRTSTIFIPRVENNRGIALHVEDLSIGYEEKMVADGISLEIERGSHMVVVGDNGQGKTTFLKTIAGELPALSGSFKWGFNIKVGYYAQHIPGTLMSEDTVKQYFERVSPRDVSMQDIFQMAGNFLFKDEALKKKISVLSGGEKARLCLATLLLQKNDVLLLDEPTNHLDFETVEALADALRQSNSTIILVSHNRTFNEILATGIIEVGGGKVKRYHHNYDEYVYHVQQMLEEEVLKDGDGGGGSGGGGSGKNVVVGGGGRARHERRSESRELQKELKSIETKIAKLEAEKQILLEWFEAHYHEYSQEKNEALASVNAQLESHEKRWMEIELLLNG